MRYQRCRYFGNGVGITLPQLIGLGLQEMSVEIIIIIMIIKLKNLYNKRLRFAYPLLTTSHVHRENQTYIN